MIHYQYRHEGNEYKKRLSVERFDKNYDYYEAVFEKMRKTFGADSFTYATLGRNDRIFIQATENSAGANNFVQGLLFDADELNAQPSKYIGKMDKQPSARDAEADVLSEGKFPDTGRLAADFSITRNLKHIFGKLADAVLYGKKDERIIIIAENAESTENYIKALGLFLPLEYMKGVGFSVGCTSLPPQNVSVINYDGDTVSVGVKLIAVEAGSLDFNTCASCGYAFDTRAMRDNYGAKLSAFGEAVDGLDLSSSSAVYSFTNRIKRAFDFDGGVDLELLEMLSTLYLFETYYGDFNLARRVLKLRYCDEEQDVALIEAVNTVFDRAATNGVSAEDIALAKRAMGYSETIYYGVRDKFCNYLVDNFVKRGGEEVNTLVDFLAEETDCSKIDMLIANAQAGDIHTVKVAFGLLGKVFKKAFGSYGDIAGNAELVKRLVDFVDVKNFRRAGNDAANVFFDVVFECYESNVSKYLAAFLMASAYTSGAIATVCDLRFRGLKQMLQRRKQPADEDLDFVNAVCEILVEMSGKLPELNLESDVGSEFIYNIPAGRFWMEEYIYKLTLSQTLKLEADTRGSEYPFAKLHQELQKKLLDIDFVQDNIKSGNEEQIDGYLSFFYNLPVNEQKMAVSLKRYLEQLSNEKRVNADFVKFRTDFMYGYFGTLSEGEQTDIIKSRTPREVFYGDDLSERETVVEDTVEKTFRKPAKSSKKSFKKSKGILIWAAAFGLISALLLLLPPLVIGASVGGVVQRLVSFFEPWYLLIPVYPFAVCIVSYLLCKKGDRIAVAAKMTSLLGVLPVAFYVLSYLLFYFVRVSLVF